MGSRGSSSGIGAAKGRKEAAVKNLVAAGGKRWEKGDKDRVYLRNAMSRELDLTTDDAPWSVSHSVQKILNQTIDSAYYDVKSGKLEYEKSRYSWANNHVEKEFRRLKRGK